MTDPGHSLLTRSLFTGPSLERFRGWLSSPVGRWAIVIALLVVLEFATFIGNFTGQIAPQWDFYNQYNTEAAAWWRDGSFFHPTQWMPYAWGGYPALLDAQNSSFYLPVGLMTIFGPFTIHASATLSALHVGFGALGMFVLARSWRVSFLPAVLGLVAWFYAAGFYSNASHLDIMRAYTWVPWMFLVVGTTWRWNRWWRWPLAALILWQGVLSMYPGILVACAYVGVVYVIVGQVLFRPKLLRYLVPLAVAAGIALALALLRYLPLYLTRGAGSPSGADSSTFSPDLLGTFLYPYGGEGLPNDLTMRSFFLAAGIFALLPFAPWRSKPVRVVLAIVIPAAVLGLPFWPWHDLARMLPGLSLSRFTMSDFKPLLLLGLAMIAVLAAERLLRAYAPSALTAERPLTAEHDGRPSAPGRLTWIVSGGVLALFLLIGLLSGSFDDLGWIPQFFFLALAVALIAATAAHKLQATLAVVFIVAISATSGLSAQLATAAPWVSDRPSFERTYLGLDVDTLIARGDRLEKEQGQLAQRPERAVPTPPFDGAQAFSTLWGDAFYDRKDALMGYVNIKGAAPFEIMIKDFFPSDTTVSMQSMSFWGAPGTLVERSGSSLPTRATMAACVADGDCGSHLAVTPVSYTPGTLVYRASATADLPFEANEAYYPGWRVSACSISDAADCRTIRVHQGAHGQVSGTLPAGDWTVTLHYVLPGLKAAWLLFWAAIVAVVISAVVVEAYRWRNRRRGAHS